MEREAHPDHREDLGKMDDLDLMVNLEREASKVINNSFLTLSNIFSSFSWSM